ncbi:hypothetical protein V5P93_006787 [Actinokineospora auranticolor]|uniref:Excreted virulence factor EspC (Type VII ESX diderm) n=1 Tax=Actinokineospora auranticolor TaxID=155976 RepID=A0A2S6GWJ2_9PSEU|nr:hypothetical protein [Actinokineospora auranticolor]PPK69568.1 hypothetical protein CLV40_103178 [Actinokineospora auranticolor]
MAQPGYKYVTDELAAHREHLNAVADSLNRTSAAAGSGGSVPNAFGIVGAFIPSLLQPMVTEAAELLRAGAESVDHTSAMMGGTVTDYTATESANTGNLAAISEVLG